MPIQEQFVPVSVPETMLPEVLELIASRLRKPVSEGPVEDDTVAMDAALVRRMYVESEEPHKEMMKLLAARPDESVYTSDIAKALETEHGSRSVAGMLGAFGRRAAHRYGGHKPWASEWDPDAGESYHTMTGWVAEVINSL